MKKAMTKIGFMLNVHSIVDVITNSSDELFVGKASSKDDITKLIEEVYPDFRTEYEEPTSIKELSASELDTYLSYLCSPHCWPATKDQYPIPHGFTFEEL